MHGHDRLFDILNRFDIAESAHQVFGLVDLDCFGTHVAVGFLHGHHHLVELNVVGPERSGIHIHLVLLNKAPYGSHFRHALSGVQPIFYVEILNGTDLVQVPSPCGVPLFVAAFECIPEHLSERSCIRTEGRLHAIGKESGRQGAELFEDPGA